VLPDGGLVKRGRWSDEITGGYLAGESRELFEDLAANFSKGHAKDFGKDN
jgi:hypothetical protein